MDDVSVAAPLHPAADGSGTADFAQLLMTMSQQPAPVDPAPLPAQPDCSRTVRPSNVKKRLRSETDDEIPVDATAKGAQRLDPSKNPDTRVRPPKAATKLLAEHTWRHIRLPNAESACEGEDIVVLWAHYTHPEAMPLSKARSFLNFDLSRYASGEGD